MAYRTSDYERYQQLDFVVGIEVHLSNNHNCKGVPDGEFVDICDRLAGKYPKDFKFVGWHPHCRCYVTSILKTPEEMEANAESKNEVKDVPPNFKDWVENNQERAKGWRELPYFLKDNKKYTKDIEVNLYTETEKYFSHFKCVKTATNRVRNSYLTNAHTNLSIIEKAAINLYTQANPAVFRKLNRQLRDGVLDNFNRAFSTILSKAINELEPIKEGTVIYRTIRLNKTNLTDLVNSVGKTKEFAAFTSCSYELRNVQEFLWHKTNPKKTETDVFLVIKTKRGFSIEDFSEFGKMSKENINQREVLLDKNQNFIIEDLKRVNGCMYFYLKQL